MNATNPTPGDEKPRTEVITGIIDQAMASRAAKQNNWPGAPIGHIDLNFTHHLNSAVAAGLVKIVERPSVTNPQRAAKFVCRVQ